MCSPTPDARRARQRINGRRTRSCRRALLHSPRSRRAVGQGAAPRAPQGMIARPHEPPAMAGIAHLRGIIRRRFPGPIACRYSHMVGGAADTFADCVVNMGGDVGGNRDFRRGDHAVVGTAATSAWGHMRR